jgi:hypothetical protein
MKTLQTVPNMKQLYTLLFVAATVLTGSSVQAQTYTLDLSNSFSPSWSAGNTSGTASNIGSSGINCSVSMAFNGSGSLSSPYPRVNGSGDFMVQGSTDAMEVDVNLSNKTSYLVITYTFSKPVQNVSFGISDIDRPNGSSTWTYVDQVTVNGAGPAGTVTPALTKYNASSTIVTISGNVATANTANNGGTVSSTTVNSSDQDGTIFVNFSGNAVTSITIQYATLNASTVSSNPGLQAIAVGNISFKKSVAPVTTNVTSAAMSNSNAVTAISALSGTDDESVTSYTIATIPSVTAGTLYYNNGTSYVAITTAGQSLTPAQAASLKFDPLTTFTGNTVFTYTATDNRGIISTASNFTIPVISSTLPVTFTNFAATWNNSILVLNWTTSQEYNAAYFIVEKSNDGSNWQTLTTVAAAGNSSTARNYTANDAQAFTVTYYRLKQADLDGRFIYSKVIKAAREEKSTTTIKVYPNPVTTTATIATNSNKNQAGTIKVYNSNGIMVKQWQAQLVTGINNIDIAGAANLANGMYIVTIEDSNNNRTGSAQFIKQ